MGFTIRLVEPFAGQTIRILFETPTAPEAAVEVAVDDVAVTSSEEIALIVPLAITNVSPEQAGDRQRAV